MQEETGKDAQNETIREVERFITTSLLPLEPQREGKVGRPLVVPALALWSGMLICILRGMGSQMALWRLLAEEGVWSFDRFDVSDDAVYKRLKSAASDTFQKLFVQITDLLMGMHKQQGAGVTTTVELASFAAGVFALDGMTLDGVKKCLPTLRGVKDTVLAGKILALFDVRAQLWRRLEYRENPRENDRHSARTLLPGLPLGSLILADLGYFGFEWFDDLTDLGHFWLSRMRGKTTYTVEHVFLSQNGVLDAIVWLGKYRADRAKHAVRLVEFRINGKSYSYITNVLDPRQLSVADIARLYARRWDIEMMFNLVKTHLKLNMIWSAHQNVVIHQVYAVFTVAQIILGLRSEIARHTQADSFEISLQLLVQTLPRLLQRGQDPIQFMIEFGRKGRYIRPSTRTQINVPQIDLAAYLFPSPDLLLTRTPRYNFKP